MKVIDLSVKVGTSTYGPPSTNMRVKLEPNYRGPGFWIANTVTMSVHTGSHIDAPSHVFENGSHVDAIELSYLAGKPTIVRLPTIRESEAIKPEHLTGCNLRKGDIVLLATGWSDRMWNHFPEYYVRSPYLSEEAAKYLAASQIRAVGFDFFEEYAARLPSFTSEDFKIHRTLLGSGIILMEHMTNLLSVPDGALFVAAPLNLSSVEGTPARFLAIVEDDHTSSNR